MIDLLHERFSGKSIALLGFGREGQSTYLFLRKIFTEMLLTIADRNPGVRDNPLVQGDRYLDFITGGEYLERLASFDVIFRSPGIPVWKLVEDQANEGKSASPANGHGRIPRDRITSQTELFLEYYADQAIGVTGTKGKSTTSSLLSHILKTAGKEVILAGNIGNPLFNFVDLITPGTIIVCELSSHQLEFLRRAPHISILLNMYQEHLDAYESFEAYCQAKLNITRYQNRSDFFVYNADDPLVSSLAGTYTGSRQACPFSMPERQAHGCFIRDETIIYRDGKREVPVWKIHQDRFLRGRHNLLNILAATSAAMILGTDPELIGEGISTFKGLEHRLEYVGEFQRIHFYDDSIATISEACMEAIRAIPMVDTLIAGGFDRGIDYSGLAGFLAESAVRNFILVGDAGRRIAEHLKSRGIAGKKIFCINRFDDFREIAFRETLPGYACLLSPAAASYDEFNNFEERGKRFRELVRRSGG